MKKLLVIRFGALGDLIHVSPSLAFLQAQRPETEVHFLTAPGYQDLVERFSGVSKVWTYDKTRPWRNLFALARALRAEGVDGIVNLHPSFKTGLLSLLIGAPAAIYRKEKLAARGAAQREIPRRHAVEDFFQPFSRLLGLAMPADLTPMLPPSAGAGLPAKPSGETWIGLIPGVGGKRGNRAWELASYQALVEQLLANQPRRRVLVFGGPDETPLAQALQVSEQVEDRTARHPILETADLLRQCDLVIGGDTGPTHVAAAVGAPVVTIFGPTSIRRTGARGHGGVTALLPPDSLPCWPCELPECPFTGDDHLACMKQIPVETVLAACERELAVTRLL